MLLNCLVQLFSRYCTKKHGYYTGLNSLLSCHDVSWLISVNVNKLQLHWGSSLFCLFRSVCKQMWTITEICEITHLGNTKTRCWMWRLACLNEETVNDGRGVQAGPVLLLLPLLALGHRGVARDWPHRRHQLHLAWTQPYYTQPCIQLWIYHVSDLCTVHLYTDHVYIPVFIPVSSPVYILVYIPIQHTSLYASLYQACIHPCVRHVCSPSV